MMNKSQGVDEKISRCDKIKSKLSNNYRMNMKNDTPLPIDTKARVDWDEEKRAYNEMLGTEYVASL